MNPKPKCVIVDYIQSIAKSGKISERLEMDDYIIKFRDMCYNENIAGVLVSQMSRKVVDKETKEPSLENLKSTGALEECADTVMLIHWPYFYDKEVDACKYRIHIAKQRSGMTFHQWFRYIPQNYRFEELSKEEMEEMEKAKKQTKSGT